MPTISDPNPAKNIVDSSDTCNCYPQLYSAKFARRKVNPQENSMFTITKCTQQHLGEVARLNLIVQKLHAQTQPDYFKSDVAWTAILEEFATQLADPNQNIFIALHSSQVIGYVWCFYHERAETILTRASSTIYVNHICVDPEFTKLGAGSQLMHAVEKLAHARGVKTISLDFWTFNESAAGFFAKNGYAPYNIKMWKAV